MGGIAVSRHICFLVYTDFVLLDMSGPLEAFSHANLAKPSAYHFTIASMEGGPIRTFAGVEVATTALHTIEQLDTLIIVGAPAVPTGDWVKPMATVIRHLSSRARRIASVCTGAFVLAESGVLDGRVATTHWNYAPQLQARFPSLRVDGDRIWTEDGHVWTSAGMSAGIDMALAMIEHDVSSDAAHFVARMLVVYYRRPSGQRQFSSLLDFDPRSDRMSAVLSYVRTHLREELTVQRLAEVAHMSTRQFSRVFAMTIGVTPSKAIERIRVEAARPLIEAGNQSFEVIARSQGFGNADHMLRSFQRVIGRTPQELRRTIRQAREEGRTGRRTVGVNSDADFYAHERIRKS